MTPLSEADFEVHALFQTPAVTRGDAAERCRFDNDLWTFGDGFQTLVRS